MISSAHKLQIIIMQSSIIIQEQIAVLPLHPLWQLNMMSINDERVLHSSSSDFVDEPTDTDVLLGRGVGTNRHSGNTNFRDIVSQRIGLGLRGWEVTAVPQKASQPTLLTTPG